jgi:hypothetical protein
MRALLHLIVTVLLIVEARAQVVPTATGADTTQDENYQMSVPPTVSGEAYSTVTGAEARSNYLNTTVAVTASIEDNVPSSNRSTPIRDVMYSVTPTISFDQTTPRLHQTVLYSPGFTLYQDTSDLNVADHNGSYSLKYRWSPYLALGLSDSVYRSSNIFNRTPGGVSGSVQSLTATAIAPYANQIGNSANLVLSYQFSKNAMVGASGTSTIVKYSNQTQAAGLSDSNSRGGLGFYNRRIGIAKYVGAAYQYSFMQSTSAIAESNTQLHTIYGFYMANLKNVLLTSVAGGIQKYSAVDSSLPTYELWSPVVSASMGLQKNHFSYAASYSRTVTGSSGMLGAYRNNQTSASMRWKPVNVLAIVSLGSYSIEKNVLKNSVTANPGGHTVSGSISAEIAIGQHLGLSAGYERLHQSYSSVAVLQAAPDSNRLHFSISYIIRRSLGK